MTRIPNANLSLNVSPLYGCRCAPFYFNPNLLSHEYCRAQRNVMYNISLCNGLR